MGKQMMNSFSIRLPIMPANTNSYHDWVLSRHFTCTPHHLSRYSCHGVQNTISYVNLWDWKSKPRSGYCSATKSIQAYSIVPMLVTNTIGFLAQLCAYQEFLHSRVTTRLCKVHGKNNWSVYHLLSDTWMIVNINSKVHLKVTWNSKLVQGIERGWNWSAGKIPPRSSIAQFL